jgi:hypothetical protein
MRKTFIISAVILTLVLAGCSQPGTSAKASKQYSIDVMVGALSEAAGSRGVAADSNVAHVDITVKNSGNTVIGTGTLTSKSGSYFTGGISFGETGNLSFYAEAQTSSHSVLYKGSSTTTISGSGSIVTIMLTPSAGLVGEWLFSAFGADTSGYANNGIVSSPGTTLVSDRFGKANSAYSFSGTGVISVPDAASLNFSTGDFSISLWFCTSSTTDNMTMIEKCDGTFIGYGVYTDSGANGYVAAYDYGDAGITSPLAYANGAWHHAVYIRSGTSLKLYLDNALAATGTSACNSVSTTSALTIGNSVNGMITFNGALDDIRIYNLALDANQIGALYHEGGYGM